MMEAPALMAWSMNWWPSAFSPFTAMNMAAPSGWPVVEVKLIFLESIVTDRTYKSLFPLMEMMRTLYNMSPSFFT
jgi:hypothetical protein